MRAGDTHHNRPGPNRVGKVCSECEACDRLQLVVLCALVVCSQSTRVRLFQARLLQISDGPMRRIRIGGGIYSGLTCTSSQSRITGKRNLPSAMASTMKT